MKATRQERDHRVPCRVCLRLTWRSAAVCEAHDDEGDTAA